MHFLLKLRGEIKMKKIYFCMDSYMLRSPIFPIEVLIDMLRTDENIIEKISSNHILREGLVGTTHNLIEEVDKKKYKCD